MNELPPYLLPNDNEEYDETMSENLAITSENKPERDEKGRLLPGHTANPNGRPPGPSITDAIKRKLLEAYTNPNMPLADKKTHLEAIVEAIMHNALVNRDQKALKDIWSYIDGLPKGSFDVGVDREGLAELTEFMKNLANPENK